MNLEYQLLFDYWCLPYKMLKFPEYLRGDPIRAYGVYAFEEGFKLALHLTAPLLTQNDFNPNEQHNRED